MFAQILWNSNSLWTRKTKLYLKKLCRFINVITKHVSCFIFYVYSLRTRKHLYVPICIFFIYICIVNFIWKYVLSDSSCRDLFQHAFIFWHDNLNNDVVSQSWLYYYEQFFWNSTTNALHVHFVYIVFSCCLPYVVNLRVVK